MFAAITQCFSIRLASQDAVGLRLHVPMNIGVILVAMMNRLYAAQEVRLRFFSTKIAPSSALRSILCIVFSHTFNQRFCGD